MRAVLFDMDGVLYEGDRAVCGAAEAVSWFQRRHVPHLFVTNTTSKPREALVDKLARMGIITHFYARELYPKFRLLCDHFEILPRLETMNRPPFRAVSRTGYFSPGGAFESSFFKSIKLHKILINKRFL